MKHFLVLFALVAAVVCYDFSDPIFNEYLANSYDDFFNDQPLSLVRTRRSEDESSTNMDKCRRRGKWKYCCGEEAFENIMDEDKGIKRECFKEVTGKDKPSHGYGFHHSDPFNCDKEKMEKRKKDLICVAECTGKKKGVIDSSGELNVETLKSTTKKAFEKLEWAQPLVEKHITTCAAEAKNETKKVEAGECSDVGVKFAHCFWREFQTACPTDKIKDEKICERVKEKIKSKDFFSSKSSTDDE